MGWDRILTDLLDLFAGLYPTPADARGVAQRAELPLKFIDLSGTAMNYWGSILEQANRREKVGDLIDLARLDYPNINFPSLSDRRDEPRSAAPKLDSRLWKGSRLSGDELEKITGSQSTLLPINFLEVGLQRAKVVARVVHSGGLGTGFLTQNNLFVTNHHVLPDVTTARAASIQFNYQKNASGLDSEIEEYNLAPDDAFETSPMEGGDDWTVVRVAKHPLQGYPATQWGELTLSDADIGVGNFVNIIQHPSGLQKQIALYHNIVTYADDSRVQYLTDTLPGSSGSPVFDSDWRLVALHHSGGLIPEPGMSRPQLRNEGIHVRALLRSPKLRALLDRS